MCVMSTEFCPGPCFTQCVISHVCIYPLLVIMYMCALQVHANGSANQHSTDTTATAHQRTELKVTFKPTKDTPTSTHQTVITCTCTTRSHGTVHTCRCPAAANGDGANCSPTEDFTTDETLDSESQPLIINATVSLKVIRRIL